MDENKEMKVGKVEKTRFSRNPIFSYRNQSIKKIKSNSEYRQFSDHLDEETRKLQEKSKSKNGKNYMNNSYKVVLNTKIQAKLQEQNSKSKEEDSEER